MELPKEYGPHEITITLFVRDDGTASLWGKEVFIPHEPLEVVHVPPHGDLIDRDTLAKSCADDTTHDVWGAYANEVIISKLRCAPTVIEAEEGE